MDLRPYIELKKAEMIGYEQSWRKYTELAAAGSKEAEIHAAAMLARVGVLRSVIEDLGRTDSNAGEKTE